MATKWSELTQEQKDEINAKRRKRYLEDEAVASAARERAESARLRRSPEEIAAFNESRRRKPESLIERIERRVAQRKERFLGRVDRIQQWRKEGGKFPWPNYQDKMAMTESFLRVMHVLGRKCVACGCTNNFDFSWRIVMKQDVLRCVLPTKKEMEMVLRSPQRFQVFCLTCAQNLRIGALAWIYNPEQNPRPCGGLLSPFNDILHTMYPMDRQKLYEKIDNHEIQSLRYKFRMPNGEYIPLFIRPNRYYLHVARNPRSDLAHVTVWAARNFIRSRNPALDTRYWGAGGDTGTWGEEYLSPEFKEWLKNEVSPEVGS